MLTRLACQLLMHVIAPVNTDMQHTKICVNDSSYFLLLLLIALTLIASRDHVLDRLMCHLRVHVIAQ